MSKNSIDSFYQELIKMDYTKSPSDDKGIDKKAAQSMLEDFSSEDLEVLAEELGLLSKEASEMNIEEKVAAEEEKKEEPATEEKKEESAEKKEEEKPAEEKKEEEKKAEEESKVEEKVAAEEEKKEEPKAEEKKEEPTEKKEEKPAEEEKKEDKSASEILEEILKEGAELEADLIKEAYDVAYENLTKEGYKLSDYVGLQIGNEKVASVVTDKAEKLAYVTGKNPLIVADDIIGAMLSLVEDEPES